MRRSSAARAGVRAVLWVVLATTSARAQAPLTETLTFSTAADTYVDAGAPTSNFNSSKVLLAGGSPARVAYLRFTVTGVNGRTVRTARLRFGVAQSSVETSGVVHLIADGTWSESKLTWNTRPSVDGPALATAGPAPTAGSVVEFNLDGAIRTDGTYNLAVDAVSTQSVGYNSSAATSGLKPTLVLGVAAGPAPTVSIVQPPDASVFFEGDHVTLQGTATDATDGDLSDAIQWRSSLQGALGAGASLMTALNRGSHTITANVTDSDGIKGSAQIALSIVARPPANTAPLVAITAPIDGAAFVVGQPVTFVGSASDLEDGVLTPQLSWSSDVDGTLGSGATFTRTLSQGTHKITARVTDHGGLQGKASVTVTVASPDALEFVPKADAYVDAGTPKANFGGSSVLRVYAGATRVAYLRFAVTGVGTQQVSHAVLRLQVDSASSAASDSGGTVSALTPGTWQESTLTALTAPPVAGPALATAGPVAADDVVDFDVSGAVTGDGTYEFALTTASLDEVAYRAKESKTPPRLLLTVTGHPPLVTITAPPTGAVFFAGTAVPLTAMATDAEDGDLSSKVRWTSSLDGSLGTGAAVSPKLKLGTHTITAAVTDADGRPGSGAIVLRVRGPNVAPRVTIASPATGASAPAGTAVTLSATAKDDFDGDLTPRIQWTSSRDGVLGMGGLRTVVLSQGTHTLTASVTDSDGSVGTAQITRIVTGSAPLVTITQPRAGLPVFADAPIVLSATAIDATDGDLSAKLAWSSDLDGPLGTGATITTTALRLGTHTITASVRDADGMVGQAARAVVVRPPNAKPVLTVYSPLDGGGLLAGKPLLLAGSATDAENGDLSSSIAWTSSRDGKLGTGALLTRSSLSVGTHVITATVADRDGATATVSATVTVAPATLTFTAVADTYVDSGAQTKTFGSASGLMASGSPVRQAFFRFAVSGLNGFTIDKALLRLTVGTSGSDGSPAGGAVRAITNHTWPEKTTSWVNRPALDGLPLATAGKVSSKQTVDFDVTPALRGDGGYDFSLESPSSDPVVYQSREASKRPQLVVTLKRNGAPVVLIDAPASGAKIGANVAVALAGRAFDAERGDVSAQIAWSSSIDGSLGTGARVTVPHLSSGTHTLTATVTEPDGTTGRAQVTVRVRGANVAPVVTITAPPNGGSYPAGTTVMLGATVSDDWDDDLAAGITWTTFPDGVVGTGPAPTAILSEGPHTLTASVTDHDGAMGSASIGVTITPTPPVVTITAPAPNAVVVAGTKATFTATALDATDGDVSARLVWTSDKNGPLGTGATVSTDALTPGSHLITAAATDAGGLTAKARVTIVVDAPPTIAIVGPPDGSVLLAARPVVLAATAMDPEDGDVGRGVRWSSDRDGPLGTGRALTVPGLSVGTHVITAAVTDAGGASASATITLNMLPSTLTFAAAADTYVDASKPTVAFGSAPELFAGSSPVRQAFLRFVVSGVGSFAVQSATLRLTAGPAKADASKSGPSAYLLDGTPWAEATTTYANRPGLTGAPLATAGPVVAGQPMELDVTRAVRGDGQVDLGLTSASSDWARWLSREAPSGSPQLVVSLAQSAPAVTIFQPAPVAYLLTTTPVAFFATAVDPTDGDVSAGLTWTSDRDGLIGQGAAFTTTSLSPGTHTITAAASNRKGVAGTATVTLVVRAGTLSFDAVADTYVDALLPTTAFGADAALIAGAPPGEKDAFLRFAVTGIGTLPVADSRIQLVVRATKNASGGVGGSIRRITDNTWSETTTAWMRHPSISGTVLDTVNLPVVQGQLVAFRVGAAVTKDGVYNFALTSSSVDAVKYNSREAGTAPPRLVVAFRQPAPTGPTVAITAPAATSVTIFDDQALALAATAVDAKDGVLTKAIAWQSSVDGPLGTGGSVTVPRLTRGTHVITASAKNKTGARGVAALVVTVADRPPTIRITAPADGTVVPIGAPATFTAIALDDGTIDLSGRVAWSSDRDGQLGNGATITTSTLSPGDHVITASVANDLGTSASTSIAMAVGNATPRLSVSAPVGGTTVPEGTAVPLTAVATDIEDGDLGDTIAWSSSVQGPLGRGRSLAPVLWVVGLHHITATVTDSGGASRTVDVTVQVVMAPPVLTILAPADDSSFAGGFTLSAQALDFRDGDRSSAIRWRSSLDGALGRGASIVVPSPSVGRHVVTAQVTDGDGLTATKTIAVVVGHTPPTVRILAPDDGTSVHAWSSLSFQATASDETDGDLGASIRWSSNLSGPLGTGPSITTSALTRGTHLVTAQVANSHGLTGSAQVVVSVGTGPAARPPLVVVSAPAPGTDTPAGAPLQFTGTALSATGDISASLAWISDRDGLIGTGASFSTTMLSPGSHHVTAIVSDAAGTLGSAGVDVTVSAPTLTFRAVADAYTDELQPAANFGGDPTLQLDNQPVRRAYLRFLVSGLPPAGIDHVFVRLQVGSNATSGTDAGGEIRLVTAPWDESALTHLNKPPLTGAPLAVAGAVVPGQIVSFDVTNAVTVDGLYSFGLRTPSNNGVEYVSREGRGTGPRLVVVLTPPVPVRPTVQIDAPLDGSSGSAGPVKLTAHAADVSGKDLNPTIAWRSDRDGALGTGPSITATLTRGVHVVTATATDADGNSSTALIHVTATGPTTGGTAPAVTITSPGNGASLPFGTPVTLLGSAFDPQDGDLSFSLRWSSNLDGPLGTGPALVRALRPGTHTITATVTDTTKKTASAAIRVQVAATRVGYEDFSFGGSIEVSLDKATATKQQSRLWYHDGIWWASLFVTGRSEYHIHRLDVATQTWVDTGVQVDERGKSRQDVLCDGDKLYVASRFGFTGTPPQNRVLEYTYHRDAQTYALDPGFPVDVPGGGAEALTIAKDSLDRLWIAYALNGQVFVAHTVAGHTDWTPAIALPNPEATGASFDDDAAVITLPGGRLGVFWSNQTRQRFFFATHVDTAADTSWKLETAAAQPLVADDHFNLKLASDGRLFVGVKTSFNTAGQTTIGLLVRSPAGTWSPLYKVTNWEDGTPTRPNIALDEVNRRVYVFYATDMQDIYEKSSDMDAIAFPPTGRGTPFMLTGTNPVGGGLNDPIGTKQSLDPGAGILLVASTSETNRYWHDFIAPPVPRPHVAIAAPTDGVHVAAATLLTLTGSAISPIDGDVTSKLTWTSDIDGPLGTGASIDAFLSPGVHTITAQATDSTKLAGTTTITVTAE